jgi:hypothetical protein
VVKVQIGDKEVIAITLCDCCDRYNSNLVCPYKEIININAGVHFCDAFQSNERDRRLSKGFSLLSHSPIDFKNTDLKL